MAFPNTYESIVKEQNISDGGYVQMEWNSTDNASIPVGTACSIDSDYILFSTYHPSQQNAYGYRYSVKFLHRMAQLDYLPFYFKTQAVTGVDGSGNVTYENVVLSTYPYTGNISTIANALATCLSDHGDLGTWTADTSGLSNSVTASISFDGATIKGAAQAIADAFGVDFQFIWSSRTIKFGSFDMDGANPSYGGQAQTGANGVTETVGTLVSATDGGIQYNTFRILGGTRNMSKKTIRGQNVQVTQRLMLDGDSILGGGSPKIMKDLVFDDIYPKMELWIYDVHERRCWLTDENGKKIVDSTETDPETGGAITHYKQYSKWYFKLAYWNGTELVPYVFNTNLIIEGLPLSMEFQPNYADGALPQPLVGREFELTYFDALSPAREKEDDDVDGNGYQPSHGEFRIIFKVDGGMILPSTSEEGIRPYGDSMSLTNNKVTLVNVAMDDVYKTAAKAELLAAGQAAMAAYARDKSSFTYLTYGTPPALGGNITMVRHDLITGEVQYTVGNYQNSKGLIGRLSDKIDTIGSTGGSATTNEGGKSTRGGGVSELSIPLLSRLMGSGSVIKDSLTILKELILGTNGHGIFIDNNGDASMTIGSLTVLGATHLNEIDVNHIKHTGGLMVVTKANIIVDHVEHLDGGYDKLYFRRRDANGQAIYNQFEVNDLALMMVFNEALDGSINRYYWRQVSDIDDGTGDFGYITLMPSTANQSVPREGDVVVQFGNTTKAERQGATVLGGSGPNGGFFAVYDGFNSCGDSAPSLDNYNTAITYISPKRNKFSGNFTNIAGQDLQGQLDALRASLLSVSQQSDKQLVIWYGDDDVPLPNSSDLTHYNDPAEDWHDADVASGNTDQQQLHLEDVYYLRRNNTTRVGGRAWQWTYDSVLLQFLWVEITDVDTLAALEAADDAVVTANEAKQKVENFGDDGIISAGTEKSELLIQWQDTVAEYLKLIEQAQDYSMNANDNAYHSFYTDYVTKYGQLATMLNDGSSTNIDSIKAGTAVPAWLLSLNVDTTIKAESSTDATDLRPKPSEYRTTWKNYFDSRASLLKAIEAAAKAKTEQAQTDATNALSKIGDMGNDDKLDPSEKLTVKREFLAAWRERAEIIARCMDGVNYINDTIEANYVTPYLNAFRAVATYLNGSNGTWYTDPTTQQTSDPAYSAANALDKIPLWLHANRKDAQGNDITETIDGDTWRGLWSAFYTARTALLTALSDDAKDRADAAQQAADDAQGTADKKKRVFSTSANELPPAPYDVGDLWVNAIWYTETTVNGVTSRTYKWTGDVLYCKTARTTNAARSIDDWADAASGTTAKIANLGDQIAAEVNNRKDKTRSGLHIDATSGNLYLEVYNSATDSWNTLATIGAALVKDANNNYTGKLNLTANNVVINSDVINAIAAEIQIAAGRIDFAAGTYNIDASHITFTSGNSTLNLSDGIVTLLVNNLDNSSNALEKKLGMVIRSEGSNGEFSFGSYVNSVFKAGLQFKETTENNTTKTRLLLTADTASIDADALVLNGKTVNISASDTFTIAVASTGNSTGKLSLEGGVIEIKSNATLTLASGSTINLASGTVVMNADQLTFEGRTINISAGQTLTFTGGTANGNTQGTISFIGARILMNAEQINFKTGQFAISNGAVNTFVINSSGDVSIHGSITATEGYIGGSSGWTIEANKLSSGTIGADTSMFLATVNLSATVNGTNYTDIRLSVGSKFFVRQDGTLIANALVANNGAFSGNFSSINERVSIEDYRLFGGDITVWAGLVVYDKLLSSGNKGQDLVTVGARYYWPGGDGYRYSYGRIVLTKTNEDGATINDNSIYLSAGDGSIEGRKIIAREKVILPIITESFDLPTNGVVGETYLLGTDGTANNAHISITKTNNETVYNEDGSVNGNNPIHITTQSYLIVCVGVSKWRLFKCM